MIALLFFLIASTTTNSVEPLQFDVGTHLRIQVPGETIEGDFAKIEYPQLFLTSDSGQRSISFLDIENVAQQKYAWKTGALVLGIPSAILGGFLAQSATLGSMDAPGGEPSTAERIGLFTLGALITGIPAALMGAGIGALIPTWDSVPYDTRHSRP